MYRNLRLTYSIALATQLVAVHPTAAASENTLARFPTISKTQIVFEARNELWSMPRGGGDAKALTHDGDRKLMPRLSPDGRWLAFSARHSGRQDVYVMPAGGGVPKRLTWFPNSGGLQDELVVAWTSDSSSIVFASRRLAAHYSDSRLFQVAREGGAAVPLPLAQAGLANFDAVGKTLYFADGLHDFEARREYYGGQQQDLFSLDMKSHVAHRLTEWRGSDSAPMPFGDDLYFVSDRGGSHHQNLWVLNLKSLAARQITQYNSGSLDFPSIGDGAIGFQHDGRLVVYETGSKSLRDIDVNLQGSEGILSPFRADVAYLQRDTETSGRPDVAVAPTGTSVVFSARGRLFEVNQTDTKEIVNQLGADADHPSWSPDGRLLAYTSDSGFEQRMMLRSVEGVVTTVPRFGSGYLFSATWSPNGKLLAVPDAGRSLWLISLDGQSQKLVNTDPTGVISDASFSPEGHWLAYSTERPNQQRAIHLFDVTTGLDHIVSSPLNSDRLPRFSPDGRFLAFVSKRNAYPVESQSEHNFASIMADGVYLAALTDSVGSPMAVSGDQITTVQQHVELQNLMKRVTPVPVDAGEYGQLEFADSALIYTRTFGHWTGGPLPGSRNALLSFNLHDRKERTISDDIQQFVLSSQGKQVLFQTDSGWSLSTLKDGDVPTSLPKRHFLTDIDPRAEWKQIFEFTWRMDRDTFADKRTSGVQWSHVHDSYAHLLPTLGSRDDLTWLLRQMQGELASSHNFVEGGDVTEPPGRLPVPLLGADLAYDSKENVFRFAKIYDGDNSLPELRSPLTELGVDVEQGDLLLRVNGVALDPETDPYRAFSGLVGALTLTVQSARMHVVREFVVHPVRSERALRLNEFVTTSRELVDRMSNGRLAYVCMEDLHSDGLQQFIKQFYPQERKLGFLFDMRWNQGGYESQPILERLKRRRAGFIVNRQEGLTTIPEQALSESMATIVGRSTISDGEQFAHFFRLEKLGELVGEKTAGNVMGVGEPWNLVDGGILVIPADGVFSLDGRRLVEGVGVNPDVTVGQNQIASSSDPQLNAAVEMLVKKLSHAPVHER